MTNDPTTDDRGQGSELPSRSVLRLYERAVKSHWPITAPMRQVMIGECMAVLESSENVRDRLSAAKVLATVDSINARRETGLINAAATAQAAAASVTVNAAAGEPGSIQQLANEILNDPEYLDYLREKAMAADAAKLAKLNEAGPGIRRISQETP